MPLLFYKIYYKTTSCKKKKLILATHSYQISLITWCTGSTWNKLTIIKPYNKATGKTAVNIMGVLIQITITVETAKYSELMVIRNVRGSTVSKVSTSLDKRLTIRPFGVVSKNSIGALMILCNKSAWSFLAAWTILTDDRIAYISTNKAEIYNGHTSRLNVEIKSKHFKK